MTIGYVLVVVGLIQVVWAIWHIRHYQPGRIGIVERALADVVRSTPRQKSSLVIMIERSSNWVALVVAPFIVALGMMFIFWSE